MRLATRAIILLFCTSSALSAVVGDEQAPPLEGDSLTLERLFGEQVEWTPEANSPAFSHDGRYGAYLHKSYEDACHGYDVWLIDTQSGELSRLTGPELLAPYVKSARETYEYRLGGVGSAVPLNEELSGSWQAKSVQNEEKGVCAVELTLELRVTEDGVVTGSLHSERHLFEIESGSYQEGKLQLQTRLADYDAIVSLDAVLEEGRLEGVLLCDELGIDVEFVASREEGENKELSERSVDLSCGPRYCGVSSFTWSPTENEMILKVNRDLFRLDVESKHLRRLTRSLERKRSVSYLPDGTGYVYMNEDGMMRVHFAEPCIEQISPPIYGDEEIIAAELSPDQRGIMIQTQTGHYWDCPHEIVSIMGFEERLSQVYRYKRDLWNGAVSGVSWSVYLYRLDDLWEERHTSQKVFSFDLTGRHDEISTPQWAPDSSRVAFTTYSQASKQLSVYEALFHEGESAKEIYRLQHNGGPGSAGEFQVHYLWDSRRLVLLTELCGFRQLYTLDPVYEQLEQLTFGRFEIHPKRMLPGNRKLFVTATKDDPSQVHPYLVDLESGELKRLSVEEGVYNGAALSDDGRYLLARHEDFGKPPELDFVDIDAGLQRALTDSHTAEKHARCAPRPEYFSFENRHGQEVWGHMFKPDNWSPDESYPLLIYVYGGPLTGRNIERGTYSVLSYYFPYYMAKKHGYVCCTVDPRGGSGYGAVFEKANYGHVGEAQTEDLVDAANWFVQEQAVDPERVALHGWSFGGFQTQMCLYTAPETFAAGMAVAGPTEWDNYNRWYTTGTIAEGADLVDYTLLPLAKNLQGQLLLVHGMRDDNVLFQDSVHVYQELLRSGKQNLVELFLDPTGGHGLSGDVDMLTLFRKYESFLLQHIGAAKQPPFEW